MTASTADRLMSTNARTCAPPRALHLLELDDDLVPVVLLVAPALEDLHALVRDDRLLLFRDDLLHHAQIRLTYQRVSAARSIDVLHVAPERRGSIRGCCQIVCCHRHSRQEARATAHRKPRGARRSAELQHLCCALGVASAQLSCSQLAIRKRCMSNRQPS